MPKSKKTRKSNKIKIGRPDTVLFGYRLTRSGVFTEPVLMTVPGFEIPPSQDSENPTSCSP